MKSRIGESGKNRFGDRTPATRTGLREVAPAIYSRDGMDAVTLEKIRGETFLAKDRLRWYFDGKGGEILLGIVWEKKSQRRAN